MRTKTKYTDVVRAYAVFERSTSKFLSFVPGHITRPETCFDGYDFLWLHLSAGQTKRLPSLTDGDGHINATAKNIGFNRVRIYSY